MLLRLIVALVIIAALFTGGIMFTYATVHLYPIYADATVMQRFSLLMIYIGISLAFWFWIETVYMEKRRMAQKLREIRDREMQNSPRKFP